MWTESRGYLSRKLTKKSSYYKWLLQKSIKQLHFTYAIVYLLWVFLLLRSIVVNCQFVTMATSPVIQLCRSAESHRERKNVHTKLCNVHDTQLSPFCLIQTTQGIKRKLREKCIITQDCMDLFPATKGPENVSWKGEGKYDFHFRPYKELACQTTEQVFAKKNVSFIFYQLTWVRAFRATPLFCSALLRGIAGQKQ